MDRINLFHKANECRNQKFCASSDEDRHILNVREIELRRENKQIWDELEHFSNTGEILGKHKAFEFEKLLKVHEFTSPKDLVGIINNIPSYRSKARKKLLSITDPTRIAKIQARLKSYDILERVAKTLLGIKE